METTDTGELTDDELLFGWFLDYPQVEVMRKAIRGHDTATVQWLFEKEVFGSCAIWPGSYAFDEERTADEITEFEQEIGADNVQVMRSATQRITLRTSGSRNMTSMPLQQTAWYALGEITQGLLEYPQEGQYLPPVSYFAVKRWLPTSFKAWVKQIEVLSKPTMTFSKFDITFDAVFAGMLLVLGLPHFLPTAFREIVALFGVLFVGVAIAKCFACAWAKIVDYCLIIIGAAIIAWHIWR